MGADNPPGRAASWLELDMMGNQDREAQAAEPAGQAQGCPASRGRVSSPLKPPR